MCNCASWQRSLYKAIAYDSSVRAEITRGHLGKPGHGVGKGYTQRQTGTQEDKLDPYVPLIAPNLNESDDLWDVPFLMGLHRHRACTVPCTDEIGWCISDSVQTCSSARILCQSSEHCDGCCFTLAFTFCAISIVSNH